MRTEMGWGGEWGSIPPNLLLWGQPSSGDMLASEGRGKDSSVEVCTDDIILRSSHGDARAWVSGARLSAAAAARRGPDSDVSHAGLRERRTSSGEGSRPRLATRWKATMAWGQGKQRPPVAAWQGSPEPSVSGAGAAVSTRPRPPAGAGTGGRTAGARAAGRGGGRGPRACLSLFLGSGLVFTSAPSCPGRPRQLWGQMARGSRKAGALITRAPTSGRSPHSSAVPGTPQSFAGGTALTWPRRTDRVRADEELGVPAGRH